MTDLQINLAIAKSCGWKQFPETRTFWTQPDGGRTCHETELPKFCEDLNAMHEAEKRFNPPNGDDWGTYLGLLDDIVASRIHAPARQRAEAFLRTIGEWKP